jgi:hypothetical protein
MAAERKWEDVAKAVIANFQGKKFILGHGSTFAPAHLPTHAIERLDIATFAAYVRAFESTDEPSPSGRWTNTAEAFTFREPM